MFNDFVYAYRIFSMDSDIKKPRLEKIPLINIYIAKDYEFNSKGYSGNFELFKQTFQWKEYRAKGHIKKPIKEDVLNNLITYLKEGHKPKIYEKLLLDSKEYSILYQENDLSIILTEVAFEIFIKDVLINYCEAKSINQLEIKKGKKSSEKVDYTIAVDKYDVSESIDVLSALIGHRLKSFKEYNSWNSDAYRKRNDIIHKRKLGFKEDDSSRAWLATTKYIKVIQDLI